MDTRLLFTGLLIALEFGVGVVALFGAYALLTHLMPMDTALLAETPFNTYEIPGYLLIGIVGVPMIAASLVLLRHRRLGDFLSEYAGMLLIAWIAMEVLLIGYHSFLQPLMLVSGIVITILAVELHEFRVRR